MSERIPGPAGEDPALLVSSPQLRSGTKESSRDLAFSSQRWLRALEDIGAGNPTQSDSFFGENSVQIALSQRQSCKMNRLLVCVSHVSVGFSGEAFVSLKDPTGKITGTLSKQVVRRHGDNLRPGTVLLLQDVVVLKTPLPGSVCHLCISSQNLARVFPREQEAEVTVGLDMSNKFASGFSQHRQTAADPNRTRSLNGGANAFEYISRYDPTCRADQSVKVMNMAKQGTGSEKPATKLDDCIDDLLTGLEDDVDP